jgi:hypothetical protein
MLTGLNRASAPLAVREPTRTRGAASPATDAANAGAGAERPARKPGNSGQLIGVVTAGIPSVSAFAIFVVMAQ